VSRATRLPRPIDPLAGSRDGRYEDDAVIVLRSERLGRLPDGNWTGRTPHFVVGRDAGRIVVLQALEPRLLDDVASVLMDELFASGWVTGADTFERILTGIVLTWDDDPLAAWAAFYSASLAELDRLVDAASPAGLVPVYRRAEALVRAAGSHSVLDLGSCFGLFPLRLRAGAAGPGLDVTASDVSAGTCGLLRRVSVRLGQGLPVVHCDAAAVPLPDGCVDTVTLLHVLEHVDAEHGRRMLAEAARLARRRVVVAVPLEDEACVEHGHVRTITLADLRAEGIAARAGTPWRTAVEEHHGGWLVLTR
jgi:hypothetical protein